MSTKTLNSWSFSTLMNFQLCKHRVKIEKIDKQIQPPLVPPAGKAEHPLTRGIRVHEGGEHFVRGDPVELLPEYENFEEEMHMLRDLFALDMVEVEGEWAYDEQWNPTNWRSKNAWLRMKIDASVFMGDEALIIDFKTGKKYGNEVKYMMQAQLYQLGTFMRYPELETVYAEWWYLDVNEITAYTFKRPKGLLQLPFYQARGDAIVNEELFLPNQNNVSCRWCPWRSVEKGGTGVCRHSVV